jgi:ADP-heptose:LPS heptosyltransferase
MLFYRDEQSYYLDFARRLGCNIDKPPHYFLPIPSEGADGDHKTIVLAPGCKPEAMAAKRWPFFPELAASFEHVVLVGTDDDLIRFDGSPMVFPKHVRSFVGQLTFRETAAVIARARVVVANDSGLGHVSGALGVPTILLFGPTPDRTLGRLPPNVTIMRSDLECEPCWFGRRFRACDARVDCLNRLSLDSVVRRVSEAGRIARIDDAPLAFR